MRENNSLQDMQLRELLEIVELFRASIEGYEGDCFDRCLDERVLCAYLSELDRRAGFDRK